MSQKKQTPFDEYNWSEIQKKYMDALMSFSRAPNSSPDSFWVNAMGDWWQTVKPKASNEDADLFEKVVEQCRNYYFMSEQFSSLLEGINKLKGKNQNINSFINKKFEEIESAFTGVPTHFNWSTFIDNCEQPVELMKAAFSNMSLYSNDMFSDVNPELRKMRERFFSTPGLGYSRETQDKLQEVLKLWANYQDDYQDYQSVMAKLSHDALELMRKRIIKMSKNNEDINSMRQVYDLWVDSNEKVYGDYVFTEEYSEINGRLVNSLMAFKKKNQEITEDTLSSLNIPTNKDVNELERRHYELRKQVKAMQAEIKKLQKQLDEKETKAASRPLKKAKPKTSSKKKTKKNPAPASPKVVQFKQAKKKTKTVSRTAKKKTKAKTKKSSTKKDVIELKF